MKEIRESENNRCIVVFEADGCEKYLVTDKVLVAVGRAADMEGLKLDNAGIRLTESGRAIEVDSYMQTNVPGIYAIGDVTGKIQCACPSPSWNSFIVLIYRAACRWKNVPARISLVLYWNTGQI